MKAKWKLLHTGALALVLLVLVLLPRDGAIARASMSRASFLPTESDFVIWEWHGTNQCNETQADVAYNEDDDQYLVVFDWDLNGTDNQDIMAMSMTAEGQQVGYNPITIYAGSEDDSRPAIARDPYGNGYLVVWQRRNGGGEYDIYGCVISDTIGAPFAIATWAGDQLFPDVAYATATSRYLVVWEDHYPGWSNQPDIYGVSLDSARTDVQYMSVTGLDAAGSQTYPAVTTNGFNYRWLVTWQDSRNSGTTSNDIYGQAVSFLSGSLALEGSELPIGVLSDYAGAPAVGWGQVDPSASAYGEYLVVWSESDTMYAQRVDGQDYSLVEVPITVSDYASGKHGPAVVYAAASEDWWVIWQDNREFG